ncbi:MAG: GNAT family N-acetyltransferase [Firmicutes bacterium]|nr:GNAT family N-acetyltransferase [Bacillota bacterium]
MSYYEDFMPERKTEKLPDSYNIAVRIATPEDAQAIAVIVAEREGKDPAEIILKLNNELKRISTGNNTVIFVAEYEGKVVGYGRVKYFIPPEALPENIAPEGWYLLGLIIAPGYRRQGIGRRLTQERIDYLKNKTDKIYYFVNKRNTVSIEMHKEFNFTEITRDFVFPGAIDKTGEGILFILEST